MTIILSIIIPINNDDSSKFVQLQLTECHTDRALLSSLMFNANMTYHTYMCVCIVFALTVWYVNITGAE